MIYVFFADGFEEIEALTPVDYLRRAGKQVVTVGVTGKTVTGAHNISVITDVECDDIVFDSSLEGIVLPGGMPGTVNLENSDKVQKAIDYANEHNLLLAAICAAPSILGHKNLLHGKKAVCFPEFEQELYGAEICDCFSVTDGNIITAKGAGAAAEFSFDIIRYFCFEERALEIKSSVQTPCF